MRSKILGICIAVSMITIISLSDSAIGQRGDRSPALQPSEQKTEAAGQDAGFLDMQELIDQEYAYDRKDELRQKVSGKVDELNKRIDSIDGQVEEMRNLKSELEKSLIRLEYADESEWNDVQDRVKETAQEVSDIDLTEGQ
ncbi:MAG: hypothetical protein AB1650_07830 [Candidatus Omnitrophota bacterium]